MLSSLINKRSSSAYLQQHRLRQALLYDSVHRIRGKRGHAARSTPASTYAEPMSVGVKRLCRGQK